MGKYTSLARNLREETPQVARPSEVVVKNTCVKINTNEQAVNSKPPTAKTEGFTTLRPTTLTTLIESEKDKSRTITCIHGMEHSTCGVCSGYARWLIEDERRLRAAQTNPEALRRRYREGLER